MQQFGGIISKGDRPGHPFRGNQWTKVRTLFNSFGQRFDIPTSEYDEDSKYLAELEQRLVDSGDYGRWGPVEFPWQREHIWLSGANSPSITHMSAAAGPINFGILAQPGTNAYLKDHITRRHTRYDGSAGGQAFQSGVAAFGPHHWGYDNGAFAENKPHSTATFDLDKWLKTVVQISEDPELRNTVLFVNAPDVLEWELIPGKSGKSSRDYYPKGNWPETLKRSRRLLPVIRSLGLPASLVIQDGATVDTVPWDDIDVVFIGGSDEYKVGPEVRAIAAEARRRGMWVHVGRVNEPERLRDVAEWADSSDGTKLTRGFTENWTVRGWGDELERLRDEGIGRMEPEVIKHLPGVHDQKLHGRRGWDSYGMPVAEYDPSRPVYLRYGTWNPDREVSRNNVTGGEEDGVSVYEVDDDLNPIVPPDGEWADDDLRSRMSSDSPRLYVQGLRLLDNGYDGEPLLVEVRAVQPPDSYRYLSDDVEKHLPGLHDQRTHARNRLAGFTPDIPGFIDRRLKRRGGLTAHRFSGDEPTEGYSVALDPSMSLEIMPDEPPDQARSEIIDWINQHTRKRGPSFDDKKVFIGGWVDPDSGHIWMDVVSVWPPDQLEQAKAAAASANQIAIYDLKHGVEIPTGGTGAVTKSSRRRFIAPIDADPEELADWLLRLAGGGQFGGIVDKSAVCAICGRPLTSKESIALGFGPSHSRAQLKRALRKKNISSAVRARMQSRLDGGATGRVQPVRRKRSQNKVEVVERNEASFKAVRPGRIVYSKNPPSKTVKTGKHAGEERKDIIAIYEDAERVQAGGTSRYPVGTYIIGDDGLPRLRLPEGRSAASHALAVGGVQGGMPGFRHFDSRVDGATEDDNPFLAQMVENLRLLHKIAKRRDDENGFIRRTRQWYDGAHDEAADLADSAEKEDFDVDGAAGVLAVLSASMDWDNNVFLAREVVRLVDENPEVDSDALDLLDKLVEELNYDTDKGRMKTKRDRGYVEVKPPAPDTNLLSVEDPTTQALLLRVLSTRDHGGNPMTQLQMIDDDGNIVQKWVSADDANKVMPAGAPGAVPAPDVHTRYQSAENMAKAISIYLNPTAENLDVQLGDGIKVRSFYNNIAYPDALEGDVTIDTHAASSLVGAPYAANTEPFKTITEKTSTVDGPYVKLLMVEAFRIIAAENPDDYSSPREAQSVLWELWRDAAEPSDKESKERKQKLRDAWAKLDEPGADIEKLTAEARALMEEFIEAEHPPRQVKVQKRERITLGQAR